MFFWGQKILISTTAGNGSAPKLWSPGKYRSRNTVGEAGFRVGVAAPLVRRETPVAFVEVQHTPSYARDMTRLTMVPCHLRHTPSVSVLHAHEHIEEACEQNNIVTT